MTRGEPTGTASAEPSGRGRGRRLAVGTVLAMLVAALVALLVAPSQDSSPAATGTTKHSRATTYRVVVKSLRISAPIVSIAMSRDRVLTPPANPQDVGWWDASAKPGAAAGQTIIAGHTVHTGGGQFDHLGSIAKGAEIEIVRRKRTEHYVATKVFALSKRQVSDRAQELFGQARAKNRLVLITCGDWTGREYLTNVFVYARPVGESGTAG